MPIYEYRCESCGHEFERLSRSPGPGDARPSCPRCGTDGATRRFSTFGTRSGEPAANGGGACGCTPSGCGCRAG